MILNKFKGGRSIHDLFSFRQKITANLGKDQLSLIWVEHPICLESDLVYFKDKVLNKVSKIDHSDVRTIINRTETNAFFLNYVEILYFGSPISFANVIYTFTKPDSFYSEIEKEAMMEFTSDYYKDICVGSKSFTILLMACIFDLLYKYNSFTKPDSTNQTPDDAQDIINEISKSLSDKNELGQQIQFMHTPVKESKSIPNTSGVPAKNIMNNLINEAKEKFEKAKDFFNMMDAGKENSEKVFDETMDVMTGLDIKTFNSSHFKRFAFHIKKWAHNKKQGHTIRSHSEPLLHAEDFEEILNPEMLQFPAFIEDIMVKSTTTSVSYDVYMDISGSTEGQILNMEKRAILEFFRQNEVRDSYVFDTAIVPVDKIKLLRSSDQGGTDIDMVIKNVKHKAYPSIIITDACDNIRKYSKYAMFMIFGQFDKNKFSGEGEKFLRNRQIMYYTNGKFNYPPKNLE